MDIATLKAKGLIRPITAAPAQPVTFPYGLGTNGVHEVAEAAYGQRAAATGFALAVAQPDRKRACLWVCQAATTQDMGLIAETALQQMTGRRMPRLSVITRRASEALWAVEEAITSGAVSHVIAEVDAADFTATRRLALACERHSVAVTLLLPHRCTSTTAAATRWRISTRPSSLNRYDPCAPGCSRWHAALERCRAAPSMVGRTFDLEWNDETLSLRMVSGLASGPAAAHPAPYAPPGLQRKTG